MDMTRIFPIRARRLCRYQADSSSIRRMRSGSANFSAYRMTRRGAVESPGLSGCVETVTVHGFPLVCGINRHQRAIHCVTHCGGYQSLVYLPLFSGTALGLSVARRHSPFCFAFRRPSGLGFQQQISRANNARLRPGKRAKFLAGPTTESTSSALGSRALREAPPGVP
jgi:hypothetical protein